MATRRNPRVSVDFDDETKERLYFWASKKNQSVSEFVSDAVQQHIAYMNMDYPLPTLEQARLAQLVDEQKALTTNIANLERVVINGFESLLDMTRGNLDLSDVEEG